MTSKNNIGEAILILGLVALNIWHPDGILLGISIALTLLAVWTWHSVETDKKSLPLVRVKLEAEIELLQAKKKYYQSLSSNNTNGERNNEQQ